MSIERAIRRHVAEGSGLPNAAVIPGNSPGPRPRGLFASVLRTEDRRLAYPAYDLQEEMTATLIWRQSTFSVSWWRDGAMDAAATFDSWCASETGLLQAETAFTGDVGSIAVITGGSGYTEAPVVTITGGGGTGATAEAVLSDDRIGRIALTARGTGYGDAPTVTIAGDGGATATARGFGFRIRFPLAIRRLDEAVDEEFEERAQLDLPVMYADVVRRDEGLIDAQDGTITYGRLNDTVVVDYDG